MESKFIKNYKSISKEKITLFCLPYAGGGASAYNRWMKEMQDTITVCPIQLPGREERIMEKPYSDMKIMLEDLVPEIEHIVDGNYALWGHSMGGKIAYEIEKCMEKDGYRAQCLFISGTRIPSIPEPNPIFQLPDEIFKKELGRFEGTPKEILDNQELLDFFLPMLRADFTMDETYYDDRVTVLHTPISLLLEIKIRKLMRGQYVNGKNIHVVYLITTFMREDISSYGIMRMRSSRKFWGI